MTMRKPTVYIETTIPSYYYKTHDLVAKLDHEATVHWWDHFSKAYELFTSAYVLQELSNGHYTNQDEAVRLAESLPILAISHKIEDIAQVYMDHFVMPQGDPGDAIHLAYASHYHLDFLLTWNCANIANPNKFRHTRIINARMGLGTPDMTTPALMIEGGLPSDND